MIDRDEAELRAWAADWRADDEAAPDAAEVRRRIRSSSRRQAAFTAGEFAVTIAALALVAWQAARTPAMWNVTAMAALGVLAVAALAFTLWNRTGTWRPAAESASAHLELLALRLRRRLRALRVGLYLLAVEAVVLAGWLWFLLGERVARTGVPASTLRYVVHFALLAAWIGLFAAVCVWLMRRTRRQLREVSRLRADLAD